jgi:hypothetical protein
LRLRGKENALHGRKKCINISIHHFSAKIQYLQRKSTSKGGNLINIFGNLINIFGNLINIFSVKSKKKTREITSQKNITL